VWTELRRLGARLTWPDAGEPQWNVDDRGFNAGLRRLARRVQHWPRNARLIHQADAFQPVPGHSGQRLDRAEARRQLEAALAKPEFRRSLDETAPTKPRPITLAIPLRQVAPKVNPTHLGGINMLLATYSTGLGGSSRNRRHNIRVACAAIDGTVLLPGEVFSYNEVVGPRSEDAGFRTAPVIIHGELVPGTGGGVCQVSTTLYNAALLADLRIVRRSHHQFPVHYVPPGRDATVAYGSLDLRFANTLPQPIALDVKEVGSRVVVHVFGAPECKREVRLVNSRVQSTRPRVPAGGGPARPGKRVIVSRIVQLADGTVRREIISHDTYDPAPASAKHPTTRRRHASTTHRQRRPRPEAAPTAAPPSGEPAAGTVAAAKVSQ
jgi:vancomycin resistance protein YoaR